MGISLNSFTSHDNVVMTSFVYDVTYDYHCNVKCKWPHGECYSTFLDKKLCHLSSPPLILFFRNFKNFSVYALLSFFDLMFRTLLLVRKTRIFEKMNSDRKYKFRANFFEYCISQHIKKSPIFCPCVYCAMIGQIKRQFLWLILKIADESSILKLFHIHIIHFQPNNPNLKTK
jgi:hypothetical protein